MIEYDIEKLKTNLEALGDNYGAWNSLETLARQLELQSWPAAATWIRAIADAQIESIEAGDVVKNIHHNDSLRYDVIAVFGDRLWLDREDLNNSPFTYAACDFKKVSV